MRTPALIIGIIITSCSSILHILGIYLLNEVHRGTGRKVDNILLINLAISELLLSVGCMSRNVALLFSNSDNDFAAKVSIFLEMLYYTCFTFAYYSFMVYIPTFRCIKILLGFRSMNLLSNSRARILSNVTWIFSVFGGVVFIALYYIIKFDFMNVLFIYFYPTINSTMIIIFTTTYILIYKKFKRSENAGRSTLHRRATNSKFYIPTLLIVSFFVFTIIPDITVLIYSIVLKRESKTLYFVCIIMYNLSLIVDAIIYIFIPRVVRELLLRKVRRFFGYKIPISTRDKSTNSQAGCSQEQVYCA